MGQEAGGERAMFVEQHVRSYVNLRKSHREWGKQSKMAEPRMASGIGSLLSRYLSASAAFFMTCVTLSVAFDASRVGGGDMLLVAILGTDSAGLTQCAWAPPQAPRITKRE